MTMTYPRPGSWADRILTYVRENPEGVSNSGIVRALGVNPGPLRQTLASLEAHGLIKRAKIDGINRIEAV